MRARLTMTAEVEAGWRFYLFNWIVIGAMAVALALKLASANVSLELAGLAIAIGYIGLRGGLADANARPPACDGAWVMFMLGGAAQIVLIGAIMTPLSHGVASAGLWPHDASAFTIAEAMCGRWTAAPCVDDHALLAAWSSFAGTAIRCSIFAVPLVLAAAERFRRIEEFTLAFALTLIAIAIFSALSQTAGILIVPSAPLAAAALSVWALWPLRWTRPMVVFAFGAALAATPFDGGRSCIGLAAGAAIAALAIGAARTVGRLITRQRISAATAPLSAVAAE